MEHQTRTRWHGHGQRARRTVSMEGGDTEVARLGRRRSRRTRCWRRKAMRCAYDCWLLATNLVATSSRAPYGYTSPDMSSDCSSIFLHIASKLEADTTWHLRYLDSSKSSAKDLSQPTFAIEISHKTFSGKSGSYATGPKPKLCHVTMVAV